MQGFSREIVATQLEIAHAVDLKKTSATLAIYYDMKRL